MFIGPENGCGRSHSPPASQRRESVARRGSPSRQALYVAPGHGRAARGGDRRGPENAAPADYFRARMVHAGSRRCGDLPGWSRIGG